MSMPLPIPRVRLEGRRIPSVSRRAVLRLCYLAVFALSGQAEWRLG